MSTEKNNTQTAKHKSWHPYVEFAKRHKGDWEASLSAHYALERARRLLEDAKLLKPIADQKDFDREVPFADREGFEIIDYYVVGLVSCLEWHVKARLRDLLNFFPDRLDQNDVKDTTIAKAVVEAIANGLSVVDLVIASKRITSADAYAAHIGRVLTAIGVDRTAWDIVRTSNTPQIKYHDVKRTNEQIFRELFETRHWLVHEIDGSLVGHPLRRRTIQIDESIQWCQLVVSVIGNIEALISDHAPDRFPNRLNKSGSPIDELAHIRSDIHHLEEKITVELTSRGQKRESKDLEHFKNTRRAWNELHSSDVAFIESCLDFHSRVFDFQTPILRRILIARRDHLLELATWFGVLDQN